ncbi:MAG: hypothetical protein ACI4WM_02040 [Erysipelotrichaceae bacterium]
MTDRELKDEVMDEVSGGLNRKPYASTSLNSGYKMMCCNNCGHEFYNYTALSNCCPECGSNNISEES